MKTIIKLFLYPYSRKDHSLLAFKHIISAINHICLPNDCTPLLDPDDNVSEMLLIPLEYG
jgi:hypothetical protein